MRLLSVGGRCFAYLLGVVVLSALGVGSARAEAYADQGSAFAGCLAATKAFVAARNNPTLDGEVRCVLEGATAYRGEFQHRTTPTNAYFWAQAGIHTFPSSGFCSARPPLTGGWTRVGSAGNTCSGGCAYSGGGGGYTMTVNGRTYVSKQGATPTGGVCDGESEGGSEIGEDDCTTIGNLTQCVTSEGKHCAQASNGQRFCWNPGEAGVKRTGNEAATKAPEGASINAPATAPPNGGDWSQSGTGSVSTQNGSTTNNYNISTWISSYGSEGDGTPDGSGGEGEGDGDGPSASGGATCGMEISCSDMSSVECNQLVQTWYLRCKGVDLTGGDTCDSPPACTGDAGTCHISMTLWRMRCDGTGGQGDSDTIGQGLEEIVSGEGDGTDEPEMSGVSEGDFPEVDNLWVEKDGNDFMDQLDGSGFLSDRSCPSMPSWSVGGHAFQIELDPMCSLANQLGMLVLALSYWVGFRIISKAHGG